MAESEQLIAAMDSRVKRREERRAFFTTALGAAAVGAGAFAFASPAAAQTVTDADILNFALNLEYLEANFYLYAVNGTGVPANMTDGTTAAGTVTPGHAVTFTDPLVASYAKEIAADEIAHVKFLRDQLGSAKVSQPTIDVGFGPNNAFSMAAQAAGVVPAGTAFDPYANDVAFLLGAFIFEDVGVTAYKGAAPLLTSAAYLEAAAGILAVEAYHASIVRTTLYAKGVATPALGIFDTVQKISDLRDGADGAPAENKTIGIAPDDDQGISPVSSANGTVSNIVPLNENGLAYSRSTGQVLNVVYLNPAAVTDGRVLPERRERHHQDERRQRLTRVFLHRI